MRTFDSHTDACEPEHGTYLFAFPGFFFVHSELKLVKVNLCHVQRQSQEVFAAVVVITCRLRCSLGLVR